MELSNNSTVALPEVSGKNMDYFSKARILYNSLDEIINKQKIGIKTSAAVRGIFMDMMQLIAIICNDYNEEREDKNIEKNLEKILEKQERVLCRLESINKINKLDIAKTEQSFRPNKNFENPENTVFVKPIKECKNSNQTKEKLVKVLTEKNVKVNIKTMRPAGKNIIVSLESNEEKMKLTDAIAENDSIKIEKIKKRNPKIIMFGIEKKADVIELKNDIIDRNFLSTGILKNELKEEIKFKFPIGKRENNYLNWVVELPSKLYWIAIKKGRLYANTKSYRVEDFCQPRRCNRCYLYGHVERFCKSQEIICRHCAEKGHTADMCNKKKETVRCINCIRANKGIINSSVNHYVMDRKCPAFARAMEWERRGTDYSRDFLL